MRQMYYDRIEEIKAYVPEDRLVVWELGVDGWEPICEALGVDVPDKPFPRLHDTNEFRLNSAWSLCRRRRRRRRRWRFHLHGAVTAPVDHRRHRAGRDR